MSDRTVFSRYPSAESISMWRSRLARAQRARALSWLISGSCAAGFLLWARGQPTPRLPSSLAGCVALGLGVAAYAAATIGLCERWRTLLENQGARMGREASYRPVALGQLGNVFLPARAGDAVRIGLTVAGHEDVSTQTATGVVIAERALDISCHTVLLTGVVVAFLALRAGGVGSALAAVAAIGAIALLALAALALAAAARALAGRLEIGRRTPKLLMALLAPLIGLRRHGGRAALLSAGMWLCEIAGWWAASHAVGLNLTGFQAAYVFAIASLTLIMPVGFGAVGTLDAGVVLGVKAVGANAAPVLSFVVLLRALLVLPSLAIVAATARERQLARLRRFTVAAARGRGARRR